VVPGLRVIPPGWLRRAKARFASLRSFPLRAGAPEAFLAKMGRCAPGRRTFLGEIACRASAHRSKSGEVPAPRRRAASFPLMNVRCASAHSHR